MEQFKPLPFAGGAYADEAMPWSQQDTVNYLPVSAEKSGTASPAMLKTVPGMKLFASVGTGPIRGMRNVEGRWLIVSGTTLYQLKPDGGSVAIGTIPGVGRVDMAHNQITGGNECFISTGDGGYVYKTSTNTLAAVSDEAFMGSTCVRYLGQYLVHIEPLRRFWFHSDLADANGYSSLDRYEAESSPDRLMGLEVSQGELLALGERTIEVYRNEVSENAAFASAGVTIERGVASPYASCVLDNSVFFVGNDGVVYRLNGYTPVRISTHPLEQALADCDLRRCFCMSWEDRGHKVFYVTLQDGRTWGYDVSSGEWHRRKSFSLNRWRANALMNTGRFWLAGDMTSGKVYSLDWDFMGEGDYPLERERTFPVMFDSFRRVRNNAVRFLVDTGGQASIFDTSYSVTVTGSLPIGSIGSPYTAPFAETGGYAPYTWAAVGLPAGLSINTLGVVTGSPTVGGTYPVTIMATDRYGVSGSWSGSLLIDASSWLVYGGLSSQSMLSKTDASVSAWSTQTGVAGVPYGEFCWVSYSGGNIYLTHYGYPLGYVGKSSDRGATWTDISASASTGTTGREIMDSNGYLLLCSGQNAIQRRDKVTGTWSSFGGATSWADSIIKIGGTIYVSQGNKTQIAKSTDDGQTWAFASGTYTIFPDPCNALIATDGTRICMLRYDIGFITRLSHSDDGGASWTNDFAFSGTGKKPSGIAFSGGKWVAITQTGDVAKSADGVTWVAGGSVTATTGGYRAQLSCGNGEFMYVDFTGRKIHRSVDGGAAWAYTATLPTYGNTALGVGYIGP